MNANNSANNNERFMIKTYNYTLRYHIHDMIYGTTVREFNT